MSWYRTGKASIYAGSRELTGYGTQWADNKHSINRGHIVLLPGSGTVQLYEIETVDSDSKIILTTDYKGDTQSQADYAIINTLTSTVPDFARRLAAQLQYNQELFDSIAQWVKSDEGNVTIILPDGSEVSLPSLIQMGKDIEGASKLNATVKKISGTNVDWKGSHTYDGNLTIGITEGSFVGIKQQTGRYAAIQNTPHGAANFLNITKHEANGTLNNAFYLPAGTGVGATREWSNLNFAAYTPHAIQGGVDSAGNASLNSANGALRLYRQKDGIVTLYSRELPDNDSTYTTKLEFPQNKNLQHVATTEFVNQFVGQTIGGGSQLQHSGTKNSIAVNSNGDLGFWDGVNSRWLLRTNSNTGAADFSKALYIRDSDESSSSSKIELVSPDSNSKVGLWAYNDNRVILSGYKGGSWGNIDVYDLAKHINIEPSGVTLGNSSSAKNIWAVNSDGSVGAWNKESSRWLCNITENGVTSYGGINIEATNDYSTLRLRGKDNQQFLLGTHGGIAGEMYWVRKNASGTKLAYLSMPLVHASGTVVTAADSSLSSVYVDGSGYVKKSSPIVKVFPSGSFEVNEESEGVYVSRKSEGVYLVTGVLGYNSDMAWGVDGGLSVPKNNNNLELIFVEDTVNSNGGIIIKTFHRQHSHLPNKFQNWRIKKEENGNKIFFEDGESCDIPEYYRLDVRVEMPIDSIFNTKNRETEEEDILYRKNKERIEPLEKIDSAINSVYNNDTEEQLQLPLFEEKEV